MFNTNKGCNMANKQSRVGAGVYAYLLYDATFKTVVCTPENEKLVIEILELLIPGKRIGHIDFINKERHGLVVSEKNVTFDLLCKEKDTDEEFLVEVQNREMDSFRDRMLSYSTYPVREQLAVKLQKRRSGEMIDPMDYSLKPVYVISMVDFVLEHDSEEALEEGYISRYEIRNGRNNELLTQSMHFVFLEMGRMGLGFNEWDKCRNMLEQFIFSMKFIHQLTERPERFDSPLLRDLFDATELASMTVTQRQNYDTIMTNELDRICQISFAEKKGKAEGKAEERAENVKALLRAGFDAGTIAKALGLTPEEIEKLA